MKTLSKQRSFPPTLPFSWVLVAILPLMSVRAATSGEVPGVFLSKNAFNTQYREDPLAFTSARHPQYLPLDLATVPNAGRICNRFQLNANAREAIKQNGFVVLAGQHDDSMFTLLHEMKEEGIPIFLTSDMMLHLYYLLFDALVQETEERVLYDYLVHMTRDLLSVFCCRYEHLDGELKEAARLNAAYFSVAAQLLGEPDPWYGPDPTPDYVTTIVTQELARIEAHAGFAESPLFGYSEDYSQYAPRGHYTRTRNLQRYFKTMTWYGRMTFLLKPGLVTEERARMQTLQAVLIAETLNNPHPEYPEPYSGLAELWSDIYGVTSFLVGESDDLTPYEYANAWHMVADDATNLIALTADDVFDALRLRLAALKPPRIYGGTGEVKLRPDADEDDLYRVLNATTGMRFMGQRFVPDAYMLQKLVFPAVGSYVGNGAPFTRVLTRGGPFRCLPRGLDVMGVLGSRRALGILDGEGDTEYVNYATQVNGLRREFAQWTPGEWNRNLYGGWLYVLASLLDPMEEAHPAFMRTPAWVDKQLHTALGSWTELRHATILYAKQSGTVGSLGGYPDRDCSYAEPVPRFYNRLLALTRMMRQGLAETGFGIGGLQALETLLSRLRCIAARELEDVPLSDGDYAFLEGGFLEHIRDILAYIDDVPLKDGPLVADVHTDINSRRVVEEAVGKPGIVIVAYRLPGGRKVLGVGAVYSYYEFKRPISDRLTDEAWREMLDQGTQPERPRWTRSFRQPVEFRPDHVGDSDRDGDGMSDFHEFAAGTDPDDRTSCLRTTGVDFRGNAPTVRWQSVPGKRYRCEYSDDLRTWYLLGTPVCATGEQAAGVDADPPKAGPRYYRVKTIP